MAETKRYTPNFVVDDDNKEVLILLKKYFMRDKSFETETEFIKTTPSLKKGILILGSIGSGKTIIMKSIQKILREPFSINYCPQITAEYAAKGHDEIAPYYRKDRCFDELGFEREQKHFGNIENVMQLIIATRYNYFKESGLITHFTTNLTSDQISAFYGDRILSRLREMCNVIVLNAKEDRRKIVVPPDAINSKKQLTEDEAKKKIHLEYLDYINEIFSKYQKTGVWRFIDGGTRLYDLLISIELISRDNLHRFEGKARENVLNRNNPDNEINIEQRAIKTKVVRAINAGEGQNEIDVEMKNLMIREYFDHLLSIGDNIKDLIIEVETEKQLI